MRGRGDLIFFAGTRGTSGTRGTFVFRRSRSGAPFVFVVVYPLYSDLTVKL
jgi:hypothetical protein